MNRDEILARIEALSDQDHVADDDVDWLMAQLSDDAPEVRAEACGLLGELLTAAEIYDVLRPLVDDPAEGVRTAALEALGAVLHEAEEHDLLDLDGRPEWVTERGWIAPEDAREALAALQALAGDAAESMAIRGAALRSLGPVAHLEPVDTLIDSFLHRGDAAARHAAIEAAAGSGLRDRWATEITAAIGDESPDVRAAAALAVGRLGILDALPYLEAMTMDGDEPEQLAAAISTILLTPFEDREAAVEQLSLRGLPDDLLEEALDAVEELEYGEEGEEEEEEEEEEGDEGEAEGA
jgi:HEAT repeat protein